MKKTGIVSVRPKREPWKTIPHARHFSSPSLPSEFLTTSLSFFHFNPRLLIFLTLFSLLSLWFHILSFTALYIYIYIHICVFLRLHSCILSSFTLFGFRFHSPLSIRKCLFFSPFFLNMCDGVFVFSFPCLSLLWVLFVLQKQKNRMPNWNSMKKFWSFPLLKLGERITQWELMIQNALSRCYFFVN